MEYLNITNKEFEGYCRDGIRDESPAVFRGHHPAKEVVIYSEIGINGSYVFWGSATLLSKVET